MVTSSSSNPILVEKEEKKTKDLKKNSKDGPKQSKVSSNSVVNSSYPKTTETNGDSNNDDDKNDDDDDEEYEEYVQRVYGISTTEDDDDNGTTTTTNTPLRRRVSKLVAREYVRRRSSVEEALPKTPQGWTALVAAITAATIGYEINLQHSLTAPPITFGQFSPSSSSTPVGKTTTSNNQQMSMIYNKLTETAESIFSRKIQPSLFVGTRGSLASTAAYMFGGPSSEHETLHWKFREILTMSHDGAELGIDWEVPRQQPQEQEQPQQQVLSFEDRKLQIVKGPITQPIIIIFHGINNDSSFGYMKSLQRTFANRGWATAAVNFRGVGGVKLTTPRGYNAAFTGDIRNVVLQLSARLATPNIPLFLVGNSLGANLMTKYLGEEGYAGTLPNCVAGAVSLGNPLQIHSDHVPFPLNIVMGLGVKRTVVQNRHILHDVNDPNYQATVRKALLTSTIGKFDQVSAPQTLRNEPFPPYAPKIGYESGEAYWHDSSSYRHIRNISIPFLNVTAEDDMLVSTPSRNKLGYSLANPNVMVVETRCGGHLGWQESPPNSKSMLDFGASPWADTASADFFQAVIDTNVELEQQQQQQQQQQQREGGQVEGTNTIDLDRKTKIVEEARFDSSQLRSKL